VVLAWSTPGAALIAASDSLSMAQGVGAFLLAGALVVLTGAWGRLGRLVAQIPDGIAAGMLAGILLPFCLALPGAAKALPLVVLPMIAVFALVRLANPAFAVLASLATGLVLAFFLGAADPIRFTPALPRLTFIAPSFDLTALLGLGVPLYLVTMASQNLPGFAVLRAAGYDAPVRPALLVTGGLSMLGALAGAHSISMAAITAAICLGDDTHPDRAQRWKVGLVYAGVWICLGLAGISIIAALAALPKALMTALVGLALLGSLMASASSAFAHSEQRFAALVTLVVTASGVSILGVGAAFWGLCAGLAVHALDHTKRRPPA